MLKNNTLILSIIVSSLALSTSAFAEDKLDSGLSQDHTYEKKAKTTQGIEIVDGWQFLGDIRAGWVQYDYQNPPLEDGTATHPDRNLGHIDSKGIYVMPKLSIMSPANNRIRAKVTVAGATDFGINDEKHEKRTFVFDPNEKESFMILQEAYLSYKDSQHKFLIGREELTTPMVDSDDWYMLANSFELAYYTNNSLENITFNLGYFSKMAGVWDSGANGTEFHTMADASFVAQEDKERAGNSGITFGAFQYNDNENHNLQIWNYYAENMYNTLFMQYDYTNSLGGFSYDAGLQLMNFQGVGELADHDTTKIDYSLYSARFDGSFDFGLNFATGYAKYTDGEGQGATLGAFGGYPYFANGMIFHFFEAGSLQNAASYKAQIGYDLAKLGLDNTWIGYRYTMFDLDPKFSQNANGDAQDAMALNGIRVSYGTKTGAYFTGTYEHVDLDEEPNTFSLRLIGGYKF
ncbi:MAG: OprD family outer membrane porin [Campylobacterota bacterium]|nr:OprD family outer membrane porin [Campylobacterota bacterium]